MSTSLLTPEEVTRPAHTSHTLSITMNTSRLTPSLYTAGQSNGTMMEVQIPETYLPTFATRRSASMVMWTCDVQTDPAVQEQCIKLPRRLSMRIISIWLTSFFRSSGTFWELTQARPRRISAISAVAVRRESRTDSREARRKLHPDLKLDCDNRHHGQLWSRLVDWKALAYHFWNARSLVSFPQGEMIIVGLKLTMFLFTFWSCASEAQCRCDVYGWCGPNPLT